MDASSPNVPGASVRTAIAHRRAGRWIERALMVVGVLALGYWSWQTAATAASQAYDSWRLDSWLASSGGSGTRAARTSLDVPVLDGDLVGRLEIPDVHLMAIVREGDGAPTLQRAVGRIAGTARPGGTGNVGLAGHRDTLFRELEDVRPGHVVRLVTVHGTFSYHVEWTRVVDPGDVWVLNETDAPVLTLVTCYPFTYLGRAPRRFIVRARLVDASV